MVVDPSGSVERANPAARRLLGAVPSAGGFPWTPPAELKQPLADVLGGLPDFLPGGVEHALAFRDGGQERFYLPRVLSIRGENEILGAAVAMQDVTKFRLVDQLKSDMVSTVSHELKTPLTGLQMAVHLLLEEVVGPLNAKQVDLLLAARQDSDRLLAMVNDLLDLGRIEQGKVELDLHPVAPAELIAEAIGRSASQARDAGIELNGSDVTDLAPVLADRERLAHVFDNLVGNALKHSKRGGSVPPRGRAGRTIDPVHRRGLRRGDRPGAPGPGLREVLPGAGVAVRRRGRPGPGHRPRDRRVPRRDDPRRQRARPGDHLRLPPAPPHGELRRDRAMSMTTDPDRAHPRILIVDDEPNVRLMFRTTLESLGYALEEATDGEEALRQHEARPADLILLDLQMPRLDGMATLRRLRDSGGDVPVVIVTAHGSVPDAVAAMRLGAIDFLSKPLSPSALRQVVADVLGRTAATDAPPSPVPASASASASPTVVRHGPAAIDLTPAKRALNRREFDRAATLLEKALDLDPNAPEALTLQGVLYESRGQDHAAYHAYKTALEFDPRYVPAAENMRRYCDRFGLDHRSLAINPAAPAR